MNKYKTMGPLSHVNQLADVLKEMSERLGDKNLRRSDFLGHLGLSSKQPYLSYSRAILRMWYYQSAYSYVYHLITEEEFKAIMREYHIKDRDYWEDGRCSCYHELKCLPVL